MGHSKIDDLFNELFGFYPKKAGQAYEMLVAAAIKAITNGEVSYNKFVKGEYSDTSYQLDALLEKDNLNSMIEAKDYTIDDKKVGRDDLQKLQGALTDLNVDKGIFASATDYTKPSKKYSKATTINPSQKEIELYHIRPSTLLDEKGQIKQFEINLIVSMPRHDKGQYEVAWTNEAIEQFQKDGLIGKPIKARIDAFYNSDGSLNISLEEFTLDNQPISENIDSDWAEGCWLLRNLFIKYDDKLYGIRGMKYKIPYEKSSTTFTIKSEGSPKVLIKSEDGKVNKLLTDEQLRKLTFDNNEVK